MKKELDKVIDIADTQTNGVAEQDDSVYLQYENLYKSLSDIT